MAHCTQGMLAVIAAVLMGVLGRPKQCSLSVAPDDGFAHVLPGSDVSFVCSATCLGALSRDQLIWKDPSGKRVPVVGGKRVQAVSYNRWAVSRLVVSAARPADSGVYTCQIQHQHRLLQYTALLQVQDIRLDDPGPRRGDIFIQPEPDLGPIRPVRSAPAPLPPSPHGNHTVTWPVKHHDHDGESESELGKENSEEDGQAVGGGRVRVRREVTNPTYPTTPVDSNNGHVDNNSTVTEAADTTQPNTSQTDKTTPTKPTMTSTRDKSTNPAYTTPFRSTSTPRATLTSTPSANHSTTLTATPSATLTSTPSATPSITLTATPTPTSATSVTGAKADNDAAEDDDIRNAKAASTQDGGGEGESDFGRYGKLAFGLAMGAVVLLLYVLALVILVPRCRKRSQSLTLNTPSRHVTNGKESDVILMGERPHNPLAPMTSATGLNGEYITAVDLDNNAGGDGEMEGEREEGDKDAARKEEDEETKGQE
ncbi:uncharacterized protein, partial [Littorina saxatilis]|uniref:uncharacterized protein n=1 Tax=Littorina saxatilis TaxID=31220 RepID=UPI0038B50C16